VDIDGCDGAGLFCSARCARTDAISVRQLAADVEALKSATAVLQNLTARFPTTQEASSNNPNMHEAMQRASRPQVRQQKNITVLPD
jgi:hypothetical protein